MSRIYGTPGVSLDFKNVINPKTFPSVICFDDQCLDSTSHVFGTLLSLGWLIEFLSWKICSLFIHFDCRFSSDLLLWWSQTTRWLRKLFFILLVFKVWYKTFTESDCSNFHQATVAQESLIWTLSFTNPPVWSPCSHWPPSPPLFDFHNSLLSTILNSSQIPCWTSFPSRGIVDR